MNSGPHLQAEHIIVVFMSMEVLERVELFITENADRSGFPASRGSQEPLIRAC